MKYYDLDKKTEFVFGWKRKKMSEYASSKYRELESANENA